MEKFFIISPIRVDEDLHTRETLLLSREKCIPRFGLGAQSQWPAFRPLDQKLTIVDIVYNFALLKVRNYRDQRSGHRVGSRRAFRAKNSNKLQKKKKEFTIRNKRVYALFF